MFTLDTTCYISCCQNTKCKMRVKLSLALLCSYDNNRPVDMSPMAPSDTTRDHSRDQSDDTPENKAELAKTPHTHRYCFCHQTCWITFKVGDYLVLIVPYLLMNENFSITFFLRQHYH